MAASLKYLLKLQKNILLRHFYKRTVNPARGLYKGQPLMAAHDADFSKAQESLKTLTEDPGNQTKLEIYALFKQATVGKVDSKRPGMMDFVGRAKWDAWNALGDITQDDAQKRYIDLVANLTKAQADSSSSESGSAAPNESAKTLKIDIQDGMYIIQFNRPTKKNAFSTEMYNEIIDSLHAAANDTNSRITVVTGAGDYYSSGNDLSNFMQIDPSNMAQAAKDGGVLLERFVSSFIDHPKPLIAMLNGPAIGVAVTTLGLFDLVYASDRVTLETPFTALGQSPEGCASVTFPRLMGTGRACELMLFGKTLTAQEAKNAGLITEVFPSQTFQDEGWSRLKAYSQLPKNSMRLSKQLIRGVDKETLHSANQRECDQLVERWQSDECMEAIMNFFQKKSNL